MIGDYGGMRNRVWIHLSTLPFYGIIYCNILQSFHDDLSDPCSVDVVDSSDAVVCPFGDRVVGHLLDVSHRQNTALVWIVQFRDRVLDLSELEEVRQSEIVDLIEEGVYPLCEERHDVSLCALHSVSHLFA